MRSNAIPILFAIINTLSLNGLPLNASMERNRTCPPSRTGTGRRFKIARLMLIIAMKLKYANAPTEAAFAAASTINIGPPTCLADSEPEKSFTTTLTVSTHHSQVASRPFNGALSRPELSITFELNFFDMPILPTTTSSPDASFIVVGSGVSFTSINSAPLRTVTNNSFPGFFEKTSAISVQSLTDDPLIETTLSLLMIPAFSAGEPS